jgi:uncharacterized protein (DUF433 family)
MTTAPINHISLDDRGVAYIAGTRIKVSHIAIERNVWKRSPEAIQADFPHLTLSQIYAAFAYYCDHQAEIDEQIAEGDRYVEQMRAQYPNPLTREELMERLARRTASGREE